MPISSILDHTTYHTLDADGQDAVLALFNKSYLEGHPLTLDASKIFLKRQSLSDSLDFYGGWLDKINPARLQFLLPHQRELLEKELLFAFYLFSAQYRLDEIEHRRQNLSERSAQIKQCAYLINELRLIDKKLTPQSLLDRVISDSEKHAKYLGLTIAPAIASMMMRLGPDATKKAKEWEGAGKTATIKEGMGAVNGVRLFYWVWGGSFLSSIFSMLPDDFANNQQAQNGLAAPAPVMGYMSWVLYYTRFGINLSLLLKHTIAGPWMSAEEAKIPWQERFKTQWNQRKFALLNDSIWGLANMACFLWLFGSGMFGFYGNVVTIGLLLMDASIAAWKLWEDSTKYNANLARYIQDKEALELKLRAKSTEKEDREKSQEELLQVNKAIEQLKFNWRHKKYALTNDLVYSVGLIIGFAVMCSFLFPPAAMPVATAMILGVAGAALCYVLTTVYSAVTGGLEITKLRESSRNAKDESKKLLKDFTTEPMEEKKKQLYLDMKQLLADSDFCDRRVNFQKMKLIRAVLIDAMLPVLVFVSLMFMPMGIGLGVMAAGLALAVISSLILNRFEPKAAQMPEFDEDEFQRFATMPKPTLDILSSSNSSKKEKTPGFFSRRASEKPPFPPDEQDNDNTALLSE